MTHQAPANPAPSGASPGRQLAQLHEALRLVETIAGRSGQSPHDSDLDEAAQLSVAYDRALPIVRRRFDTLTEETAGWAAAGVEALLEAAESRPSRAAAARLAAQLDRALRDLTALLRQARPAGSSRARRAAGTAPESRSP